MIAHEQLSLNYLEKIKQAKNEAAKKELFYQLLTQFYAHDADAQSIITTMMQGAENQIKNIPIPQRNKTGRADTQYNQIIIEFEKDLKKTKNHAEIQLQEYVAGNFNSNNVQNFVLIATDCLRWCVYAITPESFLHKKITQVSDIKIEIVQDVTLSEENAKDFFFFLDALLFQTVPQRPTLDNINQDFGAKSNIFRHFLAQGKIVFEQIKTTPEIETAYTEWGKFLSIAYGSFEVDEDVFLIHTYLSVFAKLLGYAVVSKIDYILPADIPSILDGTKFKTLKIGNYVENDFFQWIHKPEYFPLLEKQILMITLKLSDYVFTKIEGDILKGMYQGLIDIETRHALGEYYTPDWLCEQVVSHFEFEKNAKMMDPSCGSGSFLLAMMRHLRKLHPDITAKELSEQVIGIDIHPLSVQIAKTTLLIGLEDILTETKQPIHLRIYLANSIIMREDTVDLFQSGYRLKIEKDVFWFHENIFKDTDYFDKVVAKLDELADRSANKAIYYEPFILEQCKSYNHSVYLTDEQLHPFYDLYKKLKRAKEEGRDSIWKYILQNNYKPYFLSNQFDYIIGNPPWFTYSSIKNGEYQQELKKQADFYKVTPKNKKNMPHLEIAAIFMARCGAYYANQTAKMAFVVPRSFLQADQHQNTRKGEVDGVCLSEVWDLKKVQNLFNVPSCVLFMDNTIANKENSLFLSEGINGRSYQGKPKQHNGTWEEVKPNVSFTRNQWYYIELGANTAISTENKKNQVEGNYYAKYFKQGATIVPRNFYFIQTNEKNITDWTQRLIYAESDALNDKDAKMPWKELKLKGYMDCMYVFRSALARNIVPFASLFLPLVTLPIEIVTTKQDKEEIKSIKLLTEHQILSRFDRELFTENGNLEAANWFLKIEELWNKHKTDNAKSMTNLDRLNFQRGITEQDLNKRYLVLYTASAKDANACIIDRKAVDLPFIVESATYVYYTDNILQAYYLCAFLHSPKANETIKDFQATGLFGARHVNKKILDVPLPQFDEKKTTHQQLAQLGEDCVKKVAQFLPTLELVENDYNVGRVRSLIRQHLTEELMAIDEVLKKINEGK